MTRFVSVPLIMAVALGGCSLFQRDEDPASVRPEPTDQAAYLKETAVEPDAKAASDTAVENALAWSEKYARAVEQLARRQEENRKLAEKNRNLQDEIASLQGELDQTRQELTEANDLLIDVRRANEEWKQSVLGYRDEMRKAHGAELEALHKVLRLLGGEVPDSAPTAGSDEAPEAGAGSAKTPAPAQARADAGAEAPNEAAPASEGDSGASTE